MERISIKSDKIHDTWGLYSHAVKANNLLFVAGQVALDRQGNLIGKGDIKRQTEQVMKNLKIILEAAGATFDDVVKITTYLVNLDDRATFHQIRKKYFKKNQPASTLVKVDSLINKDMLLEVEAIALVKSKS
jgi:reactive intermediate/imine deaminase